MPQSGAYQNAQETVNEHGFKLFLADLLLSIQVVHQQVYSH
jgi:hypothetical protein